MIAAAILCIGTELTRGEILNTNGPWLAARLTELGYEVLTIEVVDDHPDRISAALERLTARHRVLICSGGLGPTSDDLTIGVIAQLLGRKIVRHEPSYEAMLQRYRKSGGEITASRSRQVEIPEGADAFLNPVGAAPGVAVKIGECLSFFLPGVPSEMEALWEEAISLRLRAQAVRASYQVRLRTFGLPESTVGDRLAGLEEAYPGLTLGYRVDFPEVEVKVLVRREDERAAHEQALLITNEVRARLGDAVYGEGDDSFPRAVARAVQKRGWRLAMAESCTGGLLAYLMTSYPVSEFFVASAVTYSNSAKTRLLGVNEDILRGHGAVSSEVAIAMAEGARRVCNVDVALATTGIAGPTGGSPEKPLGLVYLAIAHPAGTLVERHIFSGNRNQIQRIAAYTCLALLRRVCLETAQVTPVAPRAI